MLHGRPKYPALTSGWPAFAGHDSCFRIGRCVFAKPHISLLAVCLFLAACAQPPPPPAAPPIEPWPTAGWATSSPEAQGLDSNALAYAVETIRAKHIPIHSVFVERNGYQVLDAYFFPFDDYERHDLASVTKSVVSTLVGIAQGEQKLGPASQPVFTLLPAETLPDARKAQITLGNLLSMTSGLDCSAPPGVNLLLEMEESADWVAFTLNLPQRFEPGSHFEYCAGNLHIVSTALTRATGESALDLARRELFAPLGIDDSVWPSDPEGNSRGFADLELQPRDAAKLGYLWLHHGRWQDRRIVPADYLADALSPHATVEPGIQYGYAMWLYPSHVPYDFEANGRGGQRITVVPSQNLVTVVTAGGASANLVAPMIAAAVRANYAIIANPAGGARLAVALKDAARPPVAIAPSPVPQWAQTIAGRVYRISENPLQLETLEFRFGAPDEAFALFGFADGRVDEYGIGLDGVPRLSDDSVSGHRVALSGRWRADAFDIDYDEVARIDDYQLHIVPVANGLGIHLAERTGPVDMLLTATPQ
jgi:CubicO group peptidase (beta-lactamase class C family)